MTSMATRIALLAGFAMLGLAGPATSLGLSGNADAASAQAAKVRYADIYTCMTDDGYGRKRPCSANYKAQNPNWRATDDCMTDDGYGRKRPCSANYKAKHQKVN